MKNVYFNNIAKVTSVKELRSLTGQSRRAFSDYFNIPYRTVENWEAGVNKCPDYLLELMKYRLSRERMFNKKMSKVDDDIFKNRIIFLDYDGVVNNYLFDDYGIDCSSEEEFRPKYCFPEDNYVNNYQALCWLNRLYIEYPFDIVCISTWRFYDNFAQCLYNGGLDLGIRVVDAIPSIRDDRSLEIDTWLNEHQYFGQFVILDDEELFYDNEIGERFKQDKQLIITDPNVGINIKTYEEIRLSFDYQKNKTILSYAAID